MGDGARYLPSCPEEVGSVHKRVPRCCPLGQEDAEQRAAPCLHPKPPAGSAFTQRCSLCCAGRLQPFHLCLASGIWLKCYPEAPNSCSGLGAGGRHPRCPLQLLEGLWPHLPVPGLARALRVPAVCFSHLAQTRNAHPAQPTWDQTSAEFGAEGFEYESLRQHVSSPPPS